MPDPITRVTVWSKRIRWTHGLIALSTLLLLVTGWLSQTDASFAATALGYHYLAGYVFSFALVFRVYLLVAGEKSELYRDCISKNYRDTVAEHLRFYLSFGNTELKGWYAHNPFWGPIYLAIVALSALMVLSGFAIGQIYLAGISLTGFHAFGAAVILVFTVSHIIAVILHDAKAENNGISAIISGNRYFSKAEEKASGPLEYPVTFPSPSAKKNNNS